MQLILRKQFGALGTFGARETLEETGWTFLPTAVVGVYMWQAENPSRSFLRVAVSGTLEAHDPNRPRDRGILRTRWLDGDQLLGMQARLRSPLVLRCVDDYLSGTRYPLALLSHLLPNATGAASIAASG